MQLPAVLAGFLTATDDPDLWMQVLHVVAEDASELPDNETRRYALLGSGSHWLRPNQSRWTVAGGFAWPTGYGDGAGTLFGQPPNLDWNVTLQFEFATAEWVAPKDAPTKRFRSVRIAVPSRTTRHGQAAVHAIWPRGPLIRNSNGPSSTDSASRKLAGRLWRGVWVARSSAEGRRLPRRNADRCLFTGFNITFRADDRAFGTYRSTLQWQ